MNARFCPCCWKYHHEAEMVDRGRQAFGNALAQLLNDREIRSELEDFLRDI